MLNVFRAVIDRLKALFATAAAAELEADWLVLQAERKAFLLRLAHCYEVEGLATVAQELRRQAEALDPLRPLLGSEPLPTPGNVEPDAPALPTPAPAGKAAGPRRSRRAGQP